MPRVVEIHCVEHLQSYRLAWSSLWHRTKGAAFTQTLDWFTAYCRADQTVIRPQVLLVLDDDDEVLGILPLVVRETKTAVGSFRVLGYPLALGLGRCGPVGNQASLTLLEGLRYTADAPRDWDLLDLCGITAEHIDARRTIAGLRLADLEAELDPWRTEAVVEFNFDWEAYCSSRDADRRDEVESAERKLDQRCEAVHLRHRPEGAMRGDDDPRWDLFADCLTVARRSRQATDGLTLTTPSQAELFRAAHEAAAKCGALDLNVLYLDGTPAAFVYNYVVDGVVTRVASGVDLQFEDGTVGAILTWAMLRQSHQWGDRMIDLGPAQDPWDEFFQTGTTQLLRAVHYPRNALRAQALRLGRAWRRLLPRRFA